MTEPGTVAFYSNRTMVDMMGLVTPESAIEMRRELRARVSPNWVIKTFAPEVFILPHKRLGPPFPTLGPEHEYTLRETLSAPGVKWKIIIYANSDVPE